MEELSDRTKELAHRKRRHKVELLAPAGSMDGLIGALNAGCDAVYLGGPAYGARAYAENFTEEEVVRAIRLAHLHGVRVYMTVNILTRERELQDCVDLTTRLYEQGLDGVIVQDLGVLAMLRQTCPGLLLHASTQMSATLPESVRFLKRLGVSRVVPARELSLDEIRRIRQEGVEVEAFVHGAMCYCYSGRCLFSSMLGGRSGNRGRCAGTCRLPFGILDRNQKPVMGRRPTYPLSMRDMCTLEILPELLDAGIDSFKIEGRMKKAEYAAGVTAIYRKCVDRFYAWDAAGRPGPWHISREELTQVRSLYLRSELSQGYYHERNGADLITLQQPGYAGTDEKLLEALHADYVARRPQVPVRGRAVFLPGRPALLEVSAEKIRNRAAGLQHVADAADGETLEADQVCRVCCTGPVVAAAQQHPVTAQELQRRLMRTGQEDFYFSSLTVETDGSAFVPVGTLNQLRRKALQMLETALLARTSTGPEKNGCYRRETVKELPEKSAAETTEMKAPDEETKIRGRLYALVLNREQLAGALEGGATSILLDGPLADALAAGREEWEIIPPDQLKRTTFYAALPYIFRESDRSFMEQLTQAAATRLSGRLSGFLCRTPEEIEFLMEKGYDGRYIADSSVYRWNRQSDAVVSSACGLRVLPLELAGQEMMETFRPVIDRQILPVYGRIPVMVTANCIRKSTGCCVHREEGFWYLKDRKNVLFPVRTDCSHCHNIIYNSIPLSLHSAAGDEIFRKAGGLLLSFTTEHREETRRITRFFGALCEGRTGEPFPGREAGFTTGRYRHGAL